MGAQGTLFNRRTGGLGLLVILSSLKARSPPRDPAMPAENSGALTLATCVGHRSGHGSGHGSGLVWISPSFIVPPSGAYARRWRSAAPDRGRGRDPATKEPAPRSSRVNSRHKQHCARLSCAADPRLCFCCSLKCLAQSFFLGVVKRRTQHLPTNALKLRENFVGGNFADQEK